MDSTVLFCYISFIFAIVSIFRVVSASVVQQFRFIAAFIWANVISLLFAFVFVTVYFEQNYTVHWLIIACMRVRVFRWNRQQKYFCVKDNIYCCWYNIWWWFHHVEIIMNINWQIWRRKNNAMTKKKNNNAILATAENIQWKFPRNWFESFSSNVYKISSPAAFPNIFQ